MMSSGEGVHLQGGHFAHCSIAPSSRRHGVTAYAMVASSKSVRQQRQQPRHIAAAPHIASRSTTLYHALPRFTTLYHALSRCPKAKHTVRHSAALPACAPRTTKHKLTFNSHPTKTPPPIPPSHQPSSTTRHNSTRLYHPLKPPSRSQPTAVITKKERSKNTTSLQL
ncbi:hypothetical protein L1887_56877 [Cichorium endivia]|nr:hypothetical protein L1887_56877 [Cichorium endivia]